MIPTYIFTLALTLGLANTVVSAPTCPGTLTPVNGVCTSNCLAGSYSTTGGPCVKATQFYYVPLAGATSQIPCAAGTTSLTAGASSCTRCPPTLYSKTGGGCFYCPNGQTTVDHITCNKCPAGSYSMFGETCQVSPAGTYILANGFTYASCPVGTTSAKGAQLISACAACPYGATIPGTPCVAPPYYNILITDQSGNNVQGYLSRSVSSYGIYSVVPDQPNAQVIDATSLLSSTSPQNLVGLFPGRAGKNLVISRSFDGYNGGTFDSKSYAFVVLSDGTQSDVPHTFDQKTDYYDNLGESKVWVVASVDLKGRRQLSLSFVDSNSQVVTCAKFSADPTHHSLGASCTPGSLGSYFSNLYLVPALAGSY